MFAFQDIITSVTGILILITLILALELVNQTESSPKNRTAELNTSLEKQLENIHDVKLQLQNQLDLNRRKVSPEAFFDPNSLKKKNEDLERLNRDAENNLSISQDKLVSAAKQYRRLKKVERNRSKEKEDLKRLQKQLENIRKKIAKLNNSNRLIYNPISQQKLPMSQWLVELAGTRIRVAQIGVRAAPTVLNGERQFESWLSGRNPGNYYFMVLLRPLAVDSYRSILEVLDQKGYQYGYDLIESGTVVIDKNVGASF